MAIERSDFSILVVEDNARFRETLKQALRGRFPSTEILEAADGTHALSIVDSKCPAVVFMDIKLPDENGLELTKKIKARRPGIVVIILTSYDLPEYHEAAEDIGASLFLSKGSTSMEDIVRLIVPLLAAESLRLNGGDRT